MNDNGEEETLITEQNLMMLAAILIERNGGELRLSLKDFMRWETRLPTGISYSDDPATGERVIKVHWNDFGAREVTDGVD